MPIMLIINAILHNLLPLKANPSANGPALNPIATIKKITAMICTIAVRVPNMARTKAISDTKSPKMATTSKIIGTTLFINKY